MNITVGISNRHIHLTQEDYQILFGNTEMETKAILKQPGNFASNLTVTIKTEKAELKNIRVLGKIRNYTQVELSKTDAINLKINPPLRHSGDIKNSAEVTIIGTHGQITRQCCIIPFRHIHITQQQKEEFDLPDVVSVEVSGEAGAVLNEVYVKVSDEAYFELHLNTDEANALQLKNDDIVKIIKE